MSGLKRPCGIRLLTAYLILGDGRLSEDQLIYAETRENMFIIIWELEMHLTLSLSFFVL